MGYRQMSLDNFLVVNPEYSITIINQSDLSNYRFKYFRAILRPVKLELFIYIEIKPDIMDSIKAWKWWRNDMNKKAWTWQVDLRWLKSYLVVVLAIILVLLLYSVVIISQVRSDADANNRLLVDYCCTALEKNLKSLQDFTTTLLYSEKAKKLHNYDKNSISSNDAMTHAYDLIYDVRNFAITNGMVEDIYIYYPATDQIIGSSGSYSSYVYFKTENVNMLPMKTEYEDWMNTLFSKKEVGFHTYRDLNGQNCVFYYLDALYGTTGGNRRIVVAKISPEFLRSSIEELVSTSSHKFACLMDEDGTIYAKAGTDHSFLDESDMINFRESSRKYIVYRARSGVWPLQFVTVQSFRSAYKIVGLTTSVLAIGLVVALVVGLSFSSFFAKKSKKAVGQIKNRFLGEGSATIGNDYEYIGKEIDKLLLVNQNAIAAAEQQQKIISAFFLKELLRKPNCTEKDIERLCSMYQISFENPLFSIVVAVQDAKSSRGTQEVQNILSSVADDLFSIYWAQMDNAEVFLCNFESRMRTLQAPVVEFAKQLQQKCGYKVEISPVIQSCAEIENVWRQMCSRAENGVQAVSRKTSKNPERTILREFQDAIDHDDLTAAISFVPELCRHLERVSEVNLNICRKHALLAKLYETYDNEQIRRQLDDLLYTEDPIAWEQKLISILRRLEQDIDQKVDSRQVADLAQEMIHQEYHNPQLGLQMIAEQIGVSQSYLSRLFKAKFGKSVIQYLNYYRIEQAKILMLGGSDNLKVIAMQVGFSSDVSLIRVFKSFENTTPGSYRNKK